MTQRHPLLIALVLLVCAGLSACGTTGKTSPFVVTLDLPKGQHAVSDIRIASAAMDPDAPILNAVNVRPWGRFEPNDLRNIEESLRDTIAPQLPATVRSTGPRLDVHLMIRRYMVSVSNTAGAVLASVTWAATDSNGKLIYQEQFYASDAGYLVTTAGLLKESVHKAIVRRIATTSLALASGPAAAKAQPTTFENTSTSFEETASRLPKTMVSLGNPALAAIPIPVVSIGGLLTPSGASTVQWDMAKPSQDFDWQGYLGTLYRSQSVPQSVTGPSTPVKPENPGGQAALASRTRAADPRPADALPMPGASWQYAYSMRGIGSARFNFGVRVTGVMGDVVHEIITIPSSPERIVSVSAHSLSLRTLQLPQNQALVELAPYLHSILAKNETRPWGEIAGYPAGNNTLAPWILAVRESGQEEVTVPAGTFKTTRIEVSGRRVTTPPAAFRLEHESGRFRLRAWYAPQVRRYVRLQHETWPLSGAPPDVQLVELIGYTAN